MKNKESRVGNMAVRDEIIKTLEENRGTYLSGAACEETICQPGSSLEGHPQIAGGWICDRGREQQRLQAGGGYGCVVCTGNGEISGRRVPGTVGSVPLYQLHEPCTP